MVLGSSLYFVLMGHVATLDMGLRYYHLSLAGFVTPSATMLPAVKHI
jgi:hypothetical protein